MNLWLKFLPITNFAAFRELEGHYDPFSPHIKSNILVSVGNASCVIYHFSLPSKLAQIL